MRGLLILLLVPVASAQGRPWGAPPPPKVARHPGPEELSAGDAVDLALRWLAAHQDADGRWDAAGFMKHDPANDRCDGKGNPAFDVGLTGLAMLAFLGGGFTDRGEADGNPHARTVRQGLSYLVSAQGKDGCFGPRRHVSFMYNHVIATLAVCEAYSMTGDDRYRKAAADGTAFILRAQNPGSGWRYDPRGRESDTSVTAWCVTALRSARHCGFEVPQQAFEDAVLWVDKMTDGCGRIGYNFTGGLSARYEGLVEAFPPGKGEAMTAAGTWIRLLAGPGESDAIRTGAKLCLAKPPAWNPDDGSIDVYYWYFGTLALFQVGGEEWRTWSAKLRDAVVLRQYPQENGARTGSWDPIDPWGMHEGGRIYMTALLALCLEVPHRYARGLGDEAAEAKR